MEEQEVEDRMTVSFRRAQLPRSMVVRYPGDASELYPDLQREHCFLVAEELGRVYGYLDLIISGREEEGWIRHMAVQPSFRRRGIGTHLMDVAEEWARDNGLRRIVACLQTKNDPAISLLIQRRYTFHGFIDRHYRNGDIGILYALDLGRS
jgi:GNAT superfamily N-acetyltransferase